MGRPLVVAGTIAVGVALVVVMAALLSRPHANPGTAESGGAAACSIDNASVEATNAAKDGVDASGRAISYSPANLIDSDEATAWRTPGKGIDQTVTLSFPSACDVTSIEIVNGYNKIDSNDGTDRWRQNRRVVKLRIQANSTSVTVSLNSSSRRWQTVAFQESQVNSISLTILSSAPSKVERDYTALSEIRVT